MKPSEARPRSSTMPSILSLPPSVTYSSRPVQQAQRSARGVGTIIRSISIARIQERRPECVCLERVCRSISTENWKYHRSSSAATHLCHSQAPDSSKATAADNGDDEVEEEERSMPLSTFEEFVKLNSGTWGGHFFVRFWPHLAPPSR